MQLAGNPVSGTAAPSPKPSGGPHSAGYYLVRILPPVLGGLAILFLVGFFVVVSFSGQAFSF